MKLQISMGVLVMAFAVSPLSGAAAAAPNPQQTTSFCIRCPEMVTIPAGSVLLGSTEEETTREKMPDDQAARERPRKLVTIAREFALSQTEVTVAQYREFAEATKRPAGECEAFFKVKDKFIGWLPVHGSSWKDPVFPQGPDHPVTCVNWDDANAYAAWLAARTGQKFRLPSESEWEYAARGGTTTARYWGDGVEDACRYASVADVNALRQMFTCSDGYTHTAPATYGIPNAYGLYGMLGNIGEWAADCGLPNYGTQTPADGSPYVKGDCTEHVGRGGSWWNDAYYIRAGRRYASNGRYYIMGFRVAQTLE